MNFNLSDIKNSSVGMTVVYLISALFCFSFYKDMPFLFIGIISFIFSLIYLISHLLFKKLFPDKSFSSPFSYLAKTYSDEQNRIKINIEFYLFIALNILMVLNYFIIQYVYLWAEPYLCFFIINMLILSVRNILLTLNDMYYIKPNEITLNIVLGILGLAFLSHSKIIENGQLTSSAMGAVLFVSLIICGIIGLVKFCYKNKQE